MTISSPDPRVLRGTAATAAPAARLDRELRARQSGFDTAHDARLVDPTLQRAFADVAAKARTAARAEGYAVGWAEGHRAATVQVERTAAAAEAARTRSADDETAAVRDALGALAQAATALEARAVTPADELRDAVLAGALELTETLLGRELAVATKPGLDALRRALELLPVGRPVTVRLNPSEVPAVRAALVAMSADELGREVLVLADPSVETAGAVAECDATRVDAQLGTALARVREVLAP